jgi:hypothetical protein
LLDTKRRQKRQEAGGPIPAEVEAQQQCCEYHCNLRPHHFASLLALVKIFESILLFHGFGGTLSGHHIYFHLSASMAFFFFCSLHPTPKAIFAPAQGKS